jgi:hypothetical protein
MNPMKADDPNYLVKLAELVGILLGDGCLSLNEDRATLNNRLQISFNSKMDLPYIEYVSSLLIYTLGAKPILKFRKKENTADLQIFRKEVISYLTQDIGMVLSPKWGRAVIPPIFLEKNLSYYVLRGYFDTDGALVITNNNGTIYPRLEMKVCPSPMQNQFIGILKNLNISFGVYQIGKGEVRIQINGRSNLRIWMSTIGSSNPKIVERAKKFE